MFDLDASKIVIVGVAALIFIPPKDLPRVMRQVGQFVGKMRRMASDFQGQFMDAMREADMADLRKEAQSLSDAARIDVGLSSIHSDITHAGSTRFDTMRPLSPLPAPGALDRTPAAAAPIGVEPAGASAEPPAPASDAQRPAPAPEPHATS